VLLIYFGGMIGSMLSITLFLQLGEGFSAIHAGLTLAPFALGTAVTASGALNAIQQLGGAIGVAVLGTIFFSTLADSGFAPALRATMWWQVGLLGLMLVVTPLLPRQARTPETEADGDAQTHEAEVLAA
jgi:hypothetical protein